jgi:hypothetical protein
MQSIYKAVSDFLASIFNRKQVLEAKKDVKNDAPPGYRPLYFNCWLCLGKNKFACKKFTRERKFTIECSWCGVENVVTVSVPRG